MLLVSSSINGLKLDSHSKDLAQASVNSAIRSEYTSINSESCKIIELDRETSYSVSACPSYNQIPVLVSQSDGRYSVKIGETGKTDGISWYHNRLGEMLEWRLRGDEPFAVIYRYYVDDPSGQPTNESVLAVHKVSGKVSGCIAGVIDGNIPKANEIARHFADEKIGNFECGIDSREEI